MASADPNIIYGFLAFICLLLVTLVGFQIRQAFILGSIQGQLNGLISRVERLEQEMVNFREQLANFREQLANFREQLAEVRGMMSGLHDRMDLLTRHRHNEAGQVVITPEEVTAD